MEKGISSSHHSDEDLDKMKQWDSFVVMIYIFCYLLEIKDALLTKVKLLRSINSNILLSHFI